ncbi:MAG: hypothetical protein ABIS29_01215 [Vicinamibacterales bacterium]
MNPEQIWASIANDKAALRKKTAELSFAQKLALLERMRERDVAMRKAQPRGPGKQDLSKR